MTFSDKLQRIISDKSSLLAVGLDPDPGKMPPFIQAFEAPILEFNKSIINATADLVCAYKMNLAFYEQFGIDGLRALKKTIALIPADALIILDGKRGDIGNTAEKYAHALFAELKGDAVTVNPFMGHDSVAPFLSDKRRGAFILCLTSNPGAGDFQMMPVGDGYLYEEIARKAAAWNENRNVGLVVGATQSEHVEQVRRHAPDLPLLMPGVGAQGGDLGAAVAAGQDKDGAGIIIPASRSILYVSEDTDFAQKSREAAMALRDAINQCRRNDGVAIPEMPGAGKSHGSA